MTDSQAARALTRMTWILGAVYVAGLLTLGRCAGRNAYERGRLEARTAVLDSVTKAHRREVARVDTVARVDSVRLVRWATRYDTLRTSDTVTVRDTLYVRKELADSTVRACVEAFNSCELRVAARDTLIADLTARVRLDSLAFKREHARRRWASLKAGLLGMAAGAVLWEVAR